MRSASPAIIIGAACLLGSACGLGLFADESGGADNLPIRGAGPYRVQEPDFDTPADEPYVVAQAALSLLDPTVLQWEDHSYEIFYTRVDDLGSEIWSIDLPSIDQLPSSAPRQVLVSDASWEEGAIGAAALLREGDSLVLYYRGGVNRPAIGRAVAAEAGQPFVKDPGNPIVEGDDPFVAFADGVYYMAHTDAEHRRIYLRESDEGREFGEAREILARRTGSPLAFDRLRVSAPALVLTPTLDGALHFGLFYAGSTLNDAGASVESIGYAGSFDTARWQRFLGGEPIVDAGPAGAGGPSLVIGASSATLFFHQPRQGRGRIGVALTP